MANNYLEFSEILVLGSPLRQAWLEDQLTIGDQGCAKFLSDYSDLEDDEETGFAAEWTPEGHVILFADAEGNAAHVAHLVQKYLRQFFPENSWSLTWSTRCNKKRPGEFGGGGVLVTANELFWFDAHDQVNAAKDRFEKLGVYSAWAEHKKYLAGDWEFEVGNGDTRLGYWDWVFHQIESEEADDPGTTTDGGG